MGTTQNRESFVSQCAPEPACERCVLYSAFTVKCSEGDVLSISSGCWEFKGSAEAASLGCLYQRG